MLHLKKPITPISGTVFLTGSKSISNRLLILKEVLAADFTFENLSNSEDTKLLQLALIKIKDKEPLIDVQHAGTDFRFLTAYLSSTPGSWILTGSKRLKERPILPLVDALKNLGADITYLEIAGFPPLKINGTPISGGKLKVDASISSQFISALLLVAPQLPSGLEISLEGEIVSAPYLSMTIALLKECGVEISYEKKIITVAHKNNNPSKKQFNIEGDWSSASYFYSICALSKNSEFKLMNLTDSSLQADSILPILYARLGVTSTFGEDYVILKQDSKVVSSFNHDFTNCPDIAQTIAVTCFGLGIEAHLIGLKTLKIKETDRIIALRSELEKLGAITDSTSDSLKIYPRRKELTSLSPIISTFEDHRMAMSFAPLSLICEKISIADEMVVNKSYPAFWQDLLSLGFSVNLQP